MCSGHLHIPPDIRNPNAALVVYKLSAGYKGIRHAIQNVTFDVKSGERVGVLGPNGAGKSTLFKAITGLIPHSEGEISIYGDECHSSHHRVGYVPQSENIDLHFPVTVRDVVMMGRIRLIGRFPWPGRRHWEAVDKHLERAGMADFRFRQIGELSGGQRQRVFIARALAQEPDILLLDEPFSGVDIAAEQEILNVLDKLNKQDNVPMVMTTHNLNRAMNGMFERLLLLKQGMIAFGTPEVIYQPDILQKAYGDSVGIIQQNGQTLIVADGL